MTALETVMLAYCVTAAVVIVIQTIRLELARNDRDDRDAYIRILMRRPPVCPVGLCSEHSSELEERRAA